MVTATNPSGEDLAARALPSSQPQNPTLPLEASTNETASAADTPDLPLSSQQTGEMVQVLKLFADETRIRILSELLRAGEANVQTLCRHLGQTQPAVSHHLALLKEAGMLQMRRSGKHNFYRVDGSPHDLLSDTLAPLFAIADPQEPAG